MNYMAWLKRLSAVMLAVCLFLPMSQCSGVKVEQEDAKANAVVETAVWTDITPLNVEDGFVPDVLIIILVFTWPLFFQLAAGKWKSANENYLFIASELIFLSVTSYVASQLILLGERIAYGAYVFICFAAIYLIVTLIYLGRKIALTTQSRGPPWKH